MTHESHSNTLLAPQAQSAAPGQHPGSGSQSAHDAHIAPEQQPISPRKFIAGALVLLVVAILLGGYGILRRVSSNRVLAGSTAQLAEQRVVVAPATPGAPLTSLVLPGNVTAFTDSPIYARTQGYLARWYFDIGAHVKKGDLLAEISTPELDRQLSQAEADLTTAQANANIAHIQAERYSGLVQSDAVSRQDADNYVNQAAATAAAVHSAEANVQRLKELQSFEKIYAPFDGVVTARTVDTGQLIDTGTGKELFHLQALQTLRVYAAVPEAYSQAVHKGTKIDVTFPEHPGKTYQGTLVRTADAIDPASRTLLIEIDLDNHSGEFMPGSLAQVLLKTPASVNTFTVPAAALIFRRQGLQVGTVVNGNIAHLVAVTIGEDDGATVQIATGLTASDQVIQDPPDSLIEGEKVLVVKSGSQSSGGK
jgi:RND family efflux transporter MFP subunit